MGLVAVVDGALRDSVASVGDLAEAGDAAPGEVLSGPFAGVPRQQAGGVRPLPAGAAALPVGAGTLPVAEPISALFPSPGIRRGSVVEVVGSTTLSLLTASSVLPEHDWAVAVGLPSLNLAAAGELGLDLARVALVPDPGDQWSRVVGASFDGFTVVLAGPPRRLSRGDANRLVARARERGCVLLVLGGWPLPVDHRLTLAQGQWHGLGWGSGRLRERHLEVIASGRGAAARERRLTLVLSPTGAPALETKPEMQPATKPEMQPEMQPEIQPEMKVDLACAR
jgi:hypothetical protein